MRRIGLLILLGLVGLLPIGCGSNSASPSGPVGVSGPTYTYPFLYSIGQSGSGSAGTFNTGTSGIAVGFGTLFVGDHNYSAIDKFDLGGNYLGQNNYGSVQDLGGFGLDKNHNLYVCNYVNGTVDKFDQNLNFIQSFTGTGTFAGPFDVNVDANLNLYVTDYSNGAIYKVDQTDTVLATSSGIPAGITAFYQTAMAPNGNFYVTDYNNDIVDVLNSSLVYTGFFDGSTGSAFNGPTGIVADSDGNLIVADYNNATVQKFTTSGAFLKAIGNTAASVTFGAPFFLATDSSKKLYVTDDFNQTVYVFNPY